MDRKEIKEKAKAKIKGNLWEILWPYIVIMIVSSVISSLFGPKITFNFEDLEHMITVEYATWKTALVSIFSLVIGIVQACYLKYVLDFTRTGKFDANVILKSFKEKWLNIFVANLIAGIIIALCSLLFVIPGIIMALAYTFATLIVLDTKLSGVEALKESREMMKGHKWEFFVFMLSFIGWYLLVPFTFGLLLIWLFPYMTVAEMLYYDKLKAKAKK